MPPASGHHDLFIQALVISMTAMPDLNKPAFRAMPKAAQRVKQHLCPCCGKPVGEFRDELSKREYSISGMCQACQDSVFGLSEE